MIIHKKDAKIFEKFGVKMHIYDTGDVSIVYQETEKGHAEEFYNERSAFIYYIIEGKGSWFINGQEQKVNTGDVIRIEPGNKFYYKGKLKQVLITSPKRVAGFEHHVRDIKF
jgi:mannose-6-phosphate isomerase-like protein (cupin superfamily)